MNGIDSKETKNNNNKARFMVTSAYSPEGVSRPLYEGREPRWNPSDFELKRQS